MFEIGAVDSLDCFLAAKGGAMELRQTQLRAGDETPESVGFECPF
jgi:hypothetical protein